MKKTFLSSKMNKSSDERLVDSNEYRDALNIHVSHTETGESGTVQNVKGNEKVTDIKYNGASLSERAKCIGMITNDNTETVFMFITDPGVVDMIVSFCEKDDSIKYHIVDDSGVLNFNYQYLINGINIIDDLLFFTDNYNPPRRININRVYNNVQEDDISVIKKVFRYAPPLRLISNDNSEKSFLKDKFLSFAYRFRYVDGEYSPLTPFSTAAFIPKPFSIDYSNMNVKGMENRVSQVKVFYWTGPEDVVQVDVVFKKHNSSVINVIERIDVSDDPNNTTQQILFDNKKVYTVLPSSELNRVFDNVPHKAKTQTVMGNRIMYGNYVDGHDIDTNIDFRCSLINTEFTYSNIYAADETQRMSSLHSSRDYEVGIIYEDEQGRNSTVLVSSNNTVETKVNDSLTLNNIRVNIKSDPPSWAKTYKFAIKSSKGPYETIHVKNYYYDDFDSSWFLRLEGDNPTKVKEGDNLVVKMDSSDMVTTYVEAKILDVTVKDENFITRNSTSPIEPSGVYARVKPQGYSIQAPENPVWEVNEKLSSMNDTPKQGVAITQDIDGLPSHVDIPAGSRVYIKLSDDRNARGSGAEARKSSLERTMTASQDYAHLKDFFEGENMDWSWDKSIGDPPNTGIEYIDNVPSEGHEKAVGESRVSFSVNTNGLVFYFSSGSRAAKPVYLNTNIVIDRSGGLLAFETVPVEADSEIFYEGSQTFAINNGQHQGNVQNQGSSQDAICDLNFSDCYSFGNGIESYKIKDEIASASLALGSRVSAVSEQEYKETHRFADITYSGVYNAESNINKLNEFNLSLANFKTLETSFGELQVMHPQETNILALQEDRVSNVLVGKNILTDAVGGGNVTSVPQVLGEQVVRKEEYGISNNPESFVSWGYNKFWTDAKRNAVIMMASGNLSIISDASMRWWFRDLFANNFNTEKIGAFNPHTMSYTLSSKDDLLPSDIVNRYCGETIIGTDTTEVVESFINTSYAMGTISIPYNITSGVVYVLIKYNDSIMSEVPGDVPFSGSGTLTWTKTDLDDNKYKIRIVPRNADYEITAGCIQGDALEVRKIVLWDSDVYNETIHLETNWTLGDVASAINSEIMQFEEGSNDSGETTITQGIESEGFIPYEGSTVRVAALKKDEDTLDFTHSMKYLLSDTEYSFNGDDIDTTALDADTDVVSLTDTNGEASFTYTNPDNKKYLYLIWDIR